MDKSFEQLRYDIRAKRKDTGEDWSKWTKTDSYEEAKKHAKHIEELGYLSKIIDREADNECPKCRYFVGCECFDGKTCDLYEEVNNEQRETD